jgi:hypothetical protein
MLAAGCARPEVEDPVPPKPLAGGGGESKKREPVGRSFDGVIRGRFVLAGEAPSSAIIEAMKNHNDKTCCLSGASDMETKDQKWILGKDGNTVANVVVWVQPLKPREQYFKLPPAEVDRSDDKFTRLIDQPHCAFVPHVQVCFPQYYDGTKMQPTNEKFLVKNNANCSHNFHYRGDGLKSGEGNRVMPPKTDMQFEFVPEPNPINVSCDIHPWMSARVWAFEHPFAARTDADGKFEIKGVPTDVDVNLIVWHEVAGFFGDGGKNGKKMKFNKGDNDLGDQKLTPK